ncbi:MAG: hypothetical protein GOV15_03420 [Candidatus Diapherotrites archaeon]|nr:hypothetical protein [Candidatus Diapherotrites archaeon]
MNVEELIAYAVSKKLLLPRECADFLAKRDDVTKIIDSLEQSKDLFITQDKITAIINEFESKVSSLREPFLDQPEDKLTTVEPEHKEVVKENVKVERPSYFKPVAKDFESMVNVHTKYDITERSESKGEMQDFMDYFRSRFDKLKTITLEGYTKPITPIGKLGRVSKNKEINIIGMVHEKIMTKNEHVMLTVEDESGHFKVLISKNKKDLITRAIRIVEDDVLLITGKLGSNIMFVDEFRHPDMPIRKPNVIEEDVRVVVTSDLHIGHKKFYEGAFDKFIGWLNGRVGNEKQRDVAGKVKYLIFNGDLVDGIGIYPNQEEELNITDIFKQYDVFEKFVERIPEHIDIVIIPGNHDAIRIEDPQPKLDEKYLPLTYNFKNVYSLGSPGWVDLHNVSFCLYHGYTLDPLISVVKDLSYEHPEEAMTEYLKKRHLMPRYGKTDRGARALLFPEKEDMLVIDKVPDVLVSGHVHRNGYNQYKSTLVINPGTWQGITAFMAKQGHVATPGIVPTINLKNFGISETKFIAEEGQV